MVEATGLKIMVSGHPQWNDLAAKSHENITVKQLLVGERQTDRDLTSLTFIFK
jgi:hypothetical protein